MDHDHRKGCFTCIDFYPEGDFEISNKISRRGYYGPVPVDEGECTDCRLKDPEI